MAWAQFVRLRRAGRLVGRAGGISPPSREKYRRNRNIRETTGGGRGLVYRGEPASKLSRYGGWVAMIQGHGAFPTASPLTNGDLARPPLASRIDPQRPRVPAPLPDLARLADFPSSSVIREY